MTTKRRVLVVSVFTAFLVSVSMAAEDAVRQESESLWDLLMESQEEALAQIEEGASREENVESWKYWFGRFKAALEAHPDDPNAVRVKKEMVALAHALATFDHAYYDAALDLLEDMRQYVRSEIAFFNLMNQEALVARSAYASTREEKYALRAEARWRRIRDRCMEADAPEKLIGYGVAATADLAMLYRMFPSVSYALRPGAPRITVAADLQEEVCSVLRDEARLTPVQRESLAVFKLDRGQTVRSAVTLNADAGRPERAIEFLAELERIENLERPIGWSWKSVLFREDADAYRAAAEAWLDRQEGDAAAPSVAYQLGLMEHADGDLDASGEFYRRALALPVIDAKPDLKARIEEALEALNDPDAAINRPCIRGKPIASPKE